MRRVLLTALLAVLIFSTAAFAQSAEWYVDKPISEIRFIGLTNIDETELDGITDQFLGKKFTDTLFWDLQSKLYSLNYFETFTANAVPADNSRNMVIIEFTVTERPLIKSIIFRGNLSLTKTKLLDVVALKNDDIVNDARIRMDETAIKELYIEEGYPDVTVEGKVEESDEDGYVDLFFNISEGTQVRIKSISFAGNTFASDNTLKGRLESKEQSFFSKGIFQEGLIEDDKAAIEKYYYDSGYLDMKIVDVVISETETEKEDERNYVDIVFYIEEGEEWIFGGYTFEGNTLYSDEELLAVTTSNPGKSINKSRIESDFIAIGDIYYNDGYIYNNIVPQENRDDELNEIAFNIVIDEKNRAHIENIILTGNEKTQDYVILREIPLEVGDVFSKSAIMEGLNNLYNTQYFSSVVPDMPYGSELGLMDLVINVEEQNTTDIQFGVTFTATTTSIPIIGFLKWSDTNFLGKGQSLDAGLEVSPTTQEISFGFTENWLFGQRLSAGVDLSFSHDQYTSIAQDILEPVFYIDDDGDNYHVVPDPYDGHWVWADTEYAADGVTVVHYAGDAYEGEPTTDQITNGDVLTDYDYDVANDIDIADEYLMDYESLTLSLSGSGGYTFHTPVGRFSVGTGLSFALSYVYYDPTLYRPFDKSIRDAWDVFLFTNKLWITANWDTRDLMYSPTKGFILKETLTYTGGILGGSKHYIKSTTDGDAYFKLFDLPVTDEWSFSSVLGLHGQYSMILPQYCPYNENPVGTVATTSDLLYYDGMFVARGWGTNYDNEALLDIVLDFTTPIVTGMLSMNTFVSGSAVWEELEDLKTMNIDNYLFSAGIGLQIDMPSFPISFFVVKRAKVDNEVFKFQHGSYFGSDIDDDDTGIDFVITFDLDYF